MATTLEYDIAVNSAEVESGAAAVGNLGNKLNDATTAADATKKASDDLAKSLEKQEARIKIIDGAINLLGGSVELAVGGFSALGLVSEEQAEQFQTAALGAIAFADGAKRSFDGVKSLTEGLKAYGGIAGAARKAQLALNTAILANPYVAAAAAIAVLAAGLAILVISLNDTEKAERSLAAERAKGLGADADAAEQQIKLATARGENTVEIQKQEIAARKLRIEEKAALIDSEKDSTKRLQLAKEYKALVNENRVARAELTTLIAQEEEKETAAAKTAQDKRKEDAKQAAQDRFDILNKELQDREKRIQEYEDNAEAKRLAARAKERQDTIDINAYYDELDQEAFDKEIERLKKGQEAKQKAADDSAKIDEANEFARQANLANLSSTIGSLSTLFEEGTAASKAAAIAEIAIGTGEGFINGLGIAQKSAEATGPAAAFVFPLFYAAQIAAVLAAANQAKKILATTPGGGGGGTATKPSATGGVPNIGGGAFTGNLPGTGPTPTTPVTQEPIRAYVVAQDVSTGQEANAAIRRRRRLGGG